MDILIYSGEGVSGYLLRHVLRFFSRFTPDANRYSFKRVKADYLIGEPQWEKRTKILIIPGGRDVPYHQALFGIGTERIRSFVEEGGLYVGICAGGYFGCASIYFDIPDIIINESRDLSFFRGQGYGPIYARTKFSYDRYEGVCAVPLIAECPLGSFMYYGGGTFLDLGDSFQGVSIEAYYADSKKKSFRPY